MHYVYFLYHPDGLLLYIGCSNNPRTRLLDFINREGVMAELGKLEEYPTFDEAARAELAAISVHWPPYNKKLISSPGPLGRLSSEEHKQKLRKPKSLEWRKRMSVPKSEETKIKMRKPKSAQHRANISRATMGHPAYNKRKAP